MTEIRMNPGDCRVAQLLPAAVINPDGWVEGRRWLCMTWPGNNLTATLLTDDEVAGWRVIYQED